MPWIVRVFGKFCENWILPDVSLYQQISSETACTWLTMHLHLGAFFLEEFIRRLIRRWAWELAVKNSKGMIAREQLCAVISKYNAYVDANPHIEQLIRECDINHDGIMDEFEMKVLLEVKSISDGMQEEYG